MARMTAAAMAASQATQLDSLAQSIASLPAAIAAALASTSQATAPANGGKAARPIKPGDATEERGSVKVTEGYGKHSGKVFLDVRLPGGVSQHTPEWWLWCLEHSGVIQRSLKDGKTRRISASGNVTEN